HDAQVLKAPRGPGAAEIDVEVHDRGRTVRRNGDRVRSSHDIDLTGCGYPFVRTHDGRVVGVDVEHDRRIAAAERLEERWLVSRFDRLNGERLGVNHGHA